MENIGLLNYQSIQMPQERTDHNTYCCICDKLDETDECTKIDGEWYCESCRDNLFNYCENCEKYFTDDYTHKIQPTEDDYENGITKPHYLCDECYELSHEMQSYYATRKHGESYEEWCYG